MGIITLTNFIKFHLKLVLENYTTIENLEREEGARSRYDIGRRRNWEQVSAPQLGSGGCRCTSRPQGLLVTACGGEFITRVSSMTTRSSRRSEHSGAAASLDGDTSPAPEKSAVC